MKNLIFILILLANPAYAEVTDARYTSVDHVPVTIIDDSKQVSMPSFPYGGHYDKKVQDFIDGGGSILDYDPNFGINDEALRDRAYALNSEQAQAHVEAAEANPQAGVILDTKGKVKENKRRDNRGKRNAGMTDADDAMADYVDSVMDVQDQADDIVEALTLRQDLIDWDGSVMTYPVWVAP